MKHIFQDLCPDFTWKALHGEERTIVGSNNGKKRTGIQVTDFYHGQDTKRGQIRTGAEHSRLEKTLPQGSRCGSL